MLTVASVLVVPGLLALAFAPGRSSAVGMLALAGAAMLTGVWAVSGWRQWRANAERRELEDYLCSLNDVQAIGPLAAALRGTHGAHGAMVRAALARLLDRVTPEEMPVLTLEQRRDLRRAPLYEEDVELCVAILRAFQVMGDRFERETVRMVADGTQTESRDPAVREAARECLRVLNVRAQAASEPPYLMPAPGTGGWGEFVL
jgi:hypothetical protein